MNVDLQQQLTNLQMRMINMANNSRGKVPMKQQTAYQGPEYMHQNMMSLPQPTYRPPNKLFDYHQANNQ